MEKKRAGLSSHPPGSVNYSPKYLFKQTIECFAVSSLVSCHFMNGVVDCIQVSCFCTFCQINFASGSTVLSLYTHLQVLLGAVGYDFAQELCEFSSVLSLFVSGFLLVQANFRIALSVSNSCHCQIHTNLRALALEVCT